MPRYIVAAVAGSRSPPPSSPSAAAISRPRALAARSTCFAPTRTPANSDTRALASAKLTRAAAEPVILTTPGDNEVPSIPSCRSRGKNPWPHPLQW